MWVLHGAAHSCGVTTMTRSSDHHVHHDRKKVNEAFVTRNGVEVLATLRGRLLEAPYAAALRHTKVCHRCCPRSPRTEWFPGYVKAALTALNATTAATVSASRQVGSTTNNLGNHGNHQRLQRASSSVARDLFALLRKVGGCVVESSHFLVCTATTQPQRCVMATTQAQASTRHRSPHTQLVEFLAALIYGYQGML